MLVPHDTALVGGYAGRIDCDPSSAGSLRKNGGRARSLEPNGSGPSQPTNERRPDSGRNRGGTAPDGVLEEIRIPEETPA